jgi:hypothetical protein
MAKNSKSKKAPKPQFDAVASLQRVLGIAKLGKAGKAAVRDAVRAVRKAERIAVREDQNRDKIVARQASILEKIASLKQSLKAI